MNRVRLALRILLVGAPPEWEPVRARVQSPRARVQPIPAPATAHDARVFASGSAQRPISVCEGRPEGSTGGNGDGSPSPGTSAPESVETVSQLIALRDQVQTAAEDADDGPGRAFATVARRLGEILAQERTVAFEDAGSFDATRMRAVDTLATDDPADDYKVAASVRPGYLHDGEILRRQEVIVYRLSGSGA